jgi:hypothetical protein
VYPKLLYETLPVLYAVAAWVCIKALPSPYALLPTAAFALAAVLVVIQRWYYRRQFQRPK